MKKTTWTALCVVAALFLIGAARLELRTKDTWISTQVTHVLLTSDGFRVEGASVDTHNGSVAIHGSVGSVADKEKAEAMVREVVGVTSVDNRLRVAPADPKEPVGPKTP